MTLGHLDKPQKNLIHPLNKQQKQSLNNRFLQQDSGRQDDHHKSVQICFDMFFFLFV